MAERGAEDVATELIKGISPILAKAGTRLTPDSSLADLGLDSFMLVEIFVMIEKKFGLKLLDSGIRKEDLETIKSLAAYVSSKIK